MLYKLNQTSCILATLKGIIVFAFVEKISHEEFGTSWWPREMDKDNPFNTKVNPSYFGWSVISGLHGELLSVGQKSESTPQVATGILSI